MNFKEMQDDVLYRLDITNDTTLRTNVKNWLNEAQDEFCNSEDFFFMEELKTYTTTASQENEDLPTDFSKVHSVWQEESPATLEYENPHRFRRLYPDPTATGKSLIYRLFNDEILFYPIPDDAFSIFMRYYKIPTAMSADGDTGDVPSRWQSALKWYALSIAKDQDDEPQAAERAMLKFDEQVAKAKIYYQRRENEVLRLENKDYPDTTPYTNDYPIDEA